MLEFVIIAKVLWCERNKTLQNRYIIMKVLIVIKYGTDYVNVAILTGLAAPHRIRGCRDTQAKGTPKYLLFSSEMKTNSVM